jgi:hypothetical protein
VYLGLLTVVLFPLKVASVLLLAAGLANGLDTLFALELIPDTGVTDPRYFAATYATYTLLAGVLFACARPSVRFATAATAIVFFPLYAAAHTVAMAVGYLNWLSFCLIGRRVYRDHYQGSIGREGTGWFHADAPHAANGPTA